MEPVCLGIKTLDPRPEIVYLAFKVKPVPAHGSDADAVFAWQAFGGLRYSINDRMGLSLEYHYFAAQSPSWEGESWHGSVSNNSLRFGQTRTHVISLAFDFRF